MTWTAERPAAEGYYWVRPDWTSGPGAAVVLVRHQYDDVFVVEEIGREDFEVLSARAWDKCSWAGPIQEPPQ